MTGAAVLLMCLLLISSVDAKYKANQYRRPECGLDMGPQCRHIYSPVCGSDGITYSNECVLCVHNKKNNADILIVKEGRC